MPRRLVAFAIILLTWGCASSRPALVSQGLLWEAYTASGTFESFAPPRAFDGEPYHPRLYWNAGNYPPQWIEVDLREPRRLTGLQLVVAQRPDGDTVHEVWISESPMHEDLSRARLLHTFTEFTRDWDQLRIALRRPVSARFVQIRTTRSPSWVAWMEIQVFASVRR